MQNQFTYEQVMDMGFPRPNTFHVGQQFIHCSGEIFEYWKPAREIGAWVNSTERGRIFIADVAELDGCEYLPSPEEVYNSLRSGLFLKCSGRPLFKDNFTFYLSDPGFPDKFYASGQTLCEALVNARLRSFCSPHNPF